MAISRGRLNGVRVILVLGLIFELVFGLWMLLAPKNFFDSFAQAGELYSTTVRALLALAGTVTLSWAIAIGIALLNVLGSRSLIQAIVVFLALTGVLGFYFDFFVLKQGGGAAIDVVIFILAVLLYAVYPWKAQPA